MDLHESRLKKAVSARADALEGLEQGTPGYAEALTELGRATDALLEHARQVPERRREARARTRKTWVKSLAAVQSVAAGAGVVFALVGPTSWGWLVLLVPALGCGLWQLLGTPMGSNQLPIAALCTLAALGAVLIAFHVVSGWFTVLVLVLWVAALGTAEDAGRKK
ncbi:hypothetical protein [Streptacidiphilus carbonis]|uniref:hypothetical protein n=1 Tax=Streptacidiphilus carbonis TaxID=105422 RepID=UPI00126A3F67|nr:hypothetical protein [Streptacidiphilus carbonis]